MKAAVQILNKFRQLNQRRLVMSRKPAAQAGAYVMTVMRRSIRVTDKEAPPGKPPSSKTGRLRRAIMFAVELPAVLIGASADVIGPAGGAHDKGGEFRGDDYPARPFAGPALRVAAPRVSSFWTNSL